MSLSKAFVRQPRGLILAEMVAALIGIGFLDCLSGYRIRLLPFYAGPIFVVAWCCGKRWAIAVGLLAGVISLTADWLDGDPDLQSWTKLWEIARHLGSCLAVALVGLALRNKRDAALARIALLEHSRRLENEIVQITDIEQRRIGQDLHDGLCQHLAAVACSAASLKEDLERLRLPNEANSAGELVELLQDAVIQTRDLAYRLVPAHLGRVGLVLALESLARSVTHLHGINCTFESHGIVREYEDRIAENLYRITQEAINNATRHGKARNVAVSLQTANGLTTLRIQDDGAGFSAEAGNESGMGLNIMRYRARLNGGELKIEQPKTGGALVSCVARTGTQSNEIAA
jgi:signal transduction histidine kinase